MPILVFVSTKGVQIPYGCKWKKCAGRKTFGGFNSKLNNPRWIQYLNGAIQYPNGGYTLLFEQNRKYAAESPIFNPNIHPVKLASACNHIRRIFLIILTAHHFSIWNEYERPWFQLNHLNRLKFLFILADPKLAISTPIIKSQQQGASMVHVFLWFYGLHCRSWLRVESHLEFNILSSQKNKTRLKQKLTMLEVQLSGFIVFNASKQKRNRDKN